MASGRAVGRRRSARSIQGVVGMARIVDNKLGVFVRPARLLVHTNTQQRQATLGRSRFCSAACVTFLDFRSSKAAAESAPRATARGRRGARVVCV
jgi:hypothetical protein